MTVTAKLRKVGGSTMVAIPTALLDALSLRPDAEVSMTLSGGELVIAPVRDTLTLQDLLKACDPEAPYPRDTDWTAGRRKGRELL